MRNKHGPHKCVKIVALPATPGINGTTISLSRREYKLDESSEGAKKVYFCTGCKRFYRGVHFFQSGSVFPYCMLVVKELFSGPCAPN